MLFRGGRREADAELLLLVADAEGDGVEDIFTDPSFSDISDIGLLQIRVWSRYSATE